MFCWMITGDYHLIAAQEGKRRRQRRKVCALPLVDNKERRLFKNTGVLFNAASQRKAKRIKLCSRLSRFAQRHIVILSK
jgi:hypothetical protein